MRYVSVYLKQYVIQMSQAAYQAINYFKVKRQLARTRQTKGTRHNKVTLLFELQQRMKSDRLKGCHALYPQHHYWLLS
jgi:hypothetical protein